MGNGTTIGKVRGLGSSKEGAHHWLLQRYTAIGNLFLGAYFATALVLLPSLDYDTITGWIAGPVPAIALALFIVSTMWHARLGLQVLIEDYVHDEGNRFAVLALVNLAYAAATAGGLYFLVRLVALDAGKEATEAVLRSVMGGGM